MQFIITKNRETILLGPIDWKPRFIQSEFDELYEDGDISFQYIVPPTSETYVDVGEGFEIFPITQINSPEMDLNFDQPIGPYYTYVDNSAIANYEKTDRNINEIKDTVKTVAASLRYERENSGTKAVIQNIEVTVDTSRSGRAIFVQAYTTMSDTDVIGWKFPECWLNLTKEDLGIAVNAGVTYVQSQFAWEQNIDDQVNNAQTVDDLKIIYNSMFPVLEE